MKVNVNEIKGIAARFAQVLGYVVDPKTPIMGLRVCADAIGDLSLDIVSNGYWISGKGRCSENNELIDETIEASTFINYISHLDCEQITINKDGNRLVATTDTSEYSFPILADIKITVPTIDTTNSREVLIDGDMLASVADINAKCLAGSVFSATWQRYVCVDAIGAITYADNIYVNDFANPPTGNVDGFKLLFDGTQANILRSFAGKYVNVFVIEPEDNESARTLVLDAQDYKVKMEIESVNTANNFRTNEIRAFISQARETHVILDKATLIKALTRLGIFDKNVDLKVLNYSEIRFDATGMTLFSNKSKNYERIPYSASQNPIEHTSVIRFDDLLNRLKVMTTKTVDISYAGDDSKIHALLINGNIKEMLHENYCKSRNQ